jgi:uncharacterized protein YdbL (DUF1318 family)
MEKKMTFRFLTVLAVLCTLSFHVLAADLHSARSAGVLGEQLDGYVAVLKPGAEAEAIASDINTKRKQEYARISKENSQPVDIVAKLAAVEIIKNLPAGAYYQSGDGRWVKR